MTAPKSGPSSDEIARVAYAIWEAEGQPEGCDHEHWMRAKQLIAEGRAEAEYPAAFASSGDADHGARPVQPGFEDVPPGIVPEMKKKVDPELQEAPGGRFAKQLSELAENSEEAVGRRGASRADEPASASSAVPDGSVTAPGVADAAAGGVSGDPSQPVSTGAKRRSSTRKAPAAR